VAEVAASRRRLVEAGLEQRRRLEEELRVGAERRLAAVAGRLNRLIAAHDAARGDSLADVPRLYRLERESRDTHDDGSARALARARLAAGATLLARLWRTAWVRSGG